MIHTRGHEQKDTRYAVELQGPINLSTLIAAPMSTSAGPSSFPPEIEVDGTRTRVLPDQLGAVDRAVRSGALAGRLDLVWIPKRWTTWTASYGSCSTCGEQPTHTLKRNSTTSPSAIT